MSDKTKLSRAQPLALIVVIILVLLTFFGLVAWLAAELYERAIEAVYSRPGQPMKNAVRAG